MSSGLTRRWYIKAPSIHPTDQWIQEEASSPHCGGCRELWDRLGPGSSFRRLWAGPEGAVSGSGSFSGKSWECLEEPSRAGGHGSLMQNRK